MVSSADEGEISDGGVTGLKATSLPYTERSGIDRRDRTRDSHGPSNNGSNSRRRSRSPRGYKRSHDDGNYYGERRDHDSRHYRSQYNNTSNGDSRRSRVSYEDLDRPPSRASELSYDGRTQERDHRDRDRERNRRRDRSRDRDHYNRDNSDRFADKRSRYRSPSPRGGRRDNRDFGQRFVKEGRYDGRGPSKDVTDDSNRARETGSATSQQRPGNSQSQGSDSRPNQSVSNVKGDAVVTSVPLDEEEEEPVHVNEEEEIEKRRKRRDALFASFKSKESTPQATPLLVQAIGAADRLRAMSPITPYLNSPVATVSDMSPRTPISNGASPRSPGLQEPSPDYNVPDTDLFKASDTIATNTDDGPSAADYDPTQDMREDERRDEIRHGRVVLHGEPHPADTAPVESIEEALAESTKDDDDSDMEMDMFADADDFDEQLAAAKAAKAVDPIEANRFPDAQVAKDSLLDCDDKDGYYKVRPGEIWDSRYQVKAELGRGMYAVVVRAIDITTQNPVAIKVIRTNDSLRKAGYTEIKIVQKLNEADRDNNKHIVRLERSFELRGHLCMVFESMHANLREMVKKFGSNVGLNLTAVRIYAHQAFRALAHMRKCNIIHADLKPDNILVNEQRSSLKICDLGTAIDRSDAATAHQEITPYLVSRFYRAPEIILGMPYDFGVDMWSIGCTLFELYTAKILFAGNSNNQMLKAIMEVRGRVMPKVYKRGQLSYQHFNQLGEFVSNEWDNVLKRSVVRNLPMAKPTKDLRARLTADNSSEVSEDLRLFTDLLEQCLALNPEKRIKPDEALKHPFFKNKAVR